MNSVLVAAAPSAFKLSSSAGNETARGTSIKKDISTELAQSRRYLSFHFLAPMRAIVRRCFQDNHDGNDASTGTQVDPNRLVVL